MIMTADQVAASLACSNSVVYRLVREGKLVPVNAPQPGKTKFFARFDSVTVDIFKRDVWPLEQRARPKLPEVPPLPRPSNGTVPLAVGPGIAEGAGSGMMRAQLARIEAKLDHLLKAWG